MTPSFYLVALVVACVMGTILWNLYCVLWLAVLFNDDDDDA